MSRIDRSDRAAPGRRPRGRPPYGLDVVRDLARQVGQQGQVAGFKLGFAAVRNLPARAAYRMFDSAAHLTYLRGGKGVDRLRANYARVRPELSARELDALVRQGLRSYLRYYCEAFRLQGMSQADLDRHLRIIGAEGIREELDTGTGAVVWLPHMGNWDLSAAWSTRRLAPVTTVAERLEPEEVFRDFLEFRESLGMTILPLTGGDDPFVGLKKAVARGDFVALVSDRDLTRNGVEVDLCGNRARVAKGPAVLALLTKAPLHAAAIHYEPEPSLPGGYRVVCHIGPPIPMPQEGTSAEKVAAAVQLCADFASAAIREHTEDWHMLQLVFAEDLDERRSSP